MVLLLSAYFAVFSSQLFFNFDFASLEHQQNIEQIRNEKSYGHSFYTSCKKSSSQKLNIRLNKRFEKGNVEFTHPSVIDLTVILNDCIRKYVHYNEPLKQYGYNYCSSRGPPAVDYNA